MNIQHQHMKTEVLAGISDQLPVVAGVEIATDAAGRFNLNALHRASGLGASKAPAQWLRTKQAQELVLEAEKQTVQICIVSTEGRHGGTFAHELLAVSYAGWISAAFQLQVNQVFLDYRTGKLKHAADPMAVLNDPASMRGLLLSYTEKVIGLQHQVQSMQSDVDALDRLTKSDGSMCITSAAKSLQVSPKYLFQMLSFKRWIYRRSGGKSWVAYQDKLQQGVLEHKVTSVLRSDGSERVAEQVLVTAKGLAKISKLLCVERSTQ